jgi:hypothetical protein
MRRGYRFQVTLGLAVGASLVFLAFLMIRPAGDEQVRLTANLAQLLAPLLAAASSAWAAAAGSGRTRRAWALLAASAGSWAVGQATWVWYEHLARRELPFPPWPTSATWPPSPWPRRPCWPSRAGPNGPPSRHGRCSTGP